MGRLNGNNGDRKIIRIWTRGDGGTGTPGGGNSAGLETGWEKAYWTNGIT